MVEHVAHSPSKLTVAGSILSRYISVLLVKCSKCSFRTNKGNKLTNSVSYLLVCLKFNDTFNSYGHIMSITGQESQVVVSF